MRIVTKFLGVLASCALLSCDASNGSGLPSMMVPNIKLDVLRALDKGVANTVIEGARSGADEVVKKIKEQLSKAKVTLAAGDEDKLAKVIDDGVQDHQNMITPTALTGEVLYKFTYDNKGTEEEISLKRREITDLLGEMASIRMTKADMDLILTKTGTLDKVAAELHNKMQDLSKNKGEVLKKIVKLIKCLANAGMYKSLSDYMIKDGLKDPTDCLNAAHVILTYAKDNVSAPNVVQKGSAFEALRSIVNPVTEVDDGVKLLTAPVLQAFTTLLFLQRTKGDNNGEVKDLNKYLITRGNARKVMKDTGGKLLLCDDISLEGSGLLALGTDRKDHDKAVKDLVGAGHLNIGDTAGNNAYILPAAILLDEKTGEPVIGTPVLPAPYLEYAINNGKLPPVNNIIIDVNDGVVSVLTTYATLLQLKAKAAVNTATVADVVAKNDDVGLSGVKGNIVPTEKINNPTLMVIAEGGKEAHVKPSGTTAGDGAPDSLSLYGATGGVAKKSFKLDTRAATAIMNSLFANTIAVKGSTAHDSTCNINAGPFYAARIADADCPDSSPGTVENSALYDSTAAIMLCSGKDGDIRGLSATGTQTVSIKKATVAANISTVSKCVIPGFDVNNAGDYVVTGLDATDIASLSGSSGAKEVLKGKGARLLAAIKSISKTSK